MTLPIINPFGKVVEYWAEPDITEDVAAWAKKRLGIDLYSIQRDISNSVATPRSKVLVRSCHSSGKTFLAAVVVCHHIDTHPAGEARVITTAPTNAQVRGLLWNEINSLFERAKKFGKPLPGRVNQTEWWIGPYLAGVGRKPSDYVDGDSTNNQQQHMSGYHARYPLIVVDEADGIPATLWNSLDTLLTNVNAKLFAIGNPYDPTSVFAKMQTMEQVYQVFRIAAWDTPNFSGEEVPQLLREVLLHPDWVISRRLMWGGVEALGQDIHVPVDHPFWSVQVEAEYPAESELTIVRAADMAACLLPTEGVNGIPLKPTGPVQLGVDVAGSESGDKTVIRERVGSFMMRRWEIQTRDDDAIEDFICDKIVQTGAGTICIDVTGGFGWGFVGRIRKRHPRVTIVEFNFGAGAGDRDHYRNARAELYWSGREAARDRKWNWAYAENADSTIAELCSVRKIPGTKLIQVEDKDDVRRRLGHSPDDADAALLAWWRGKGFGEAKVSSARGAEVPVGSRAVARGAGLGARGQQVGSRASIAIGRR